jgi:plasmid replication initiation protein
MMDEKRKKREVVFNEEHHVDVKNEFITADYPEKVTAADMKMLRFIISQCQQGDREFFEYEFSAADIAEFLNMDKFNLYREARDMTEKRLFNCNLRIGAEEDHELIHLFKKCKYRKGLFTMQMDDEAARLFLDLTKNFTEIPIAPILMMKNKNSIRIYELICQKFMSKYPYNRNAKVITISLEELRTVTDALNKKSYDHAGHFKDKILKPSIKEIETAADWKIEVKDLKRSRKVTGFELTVWDRYGYELVEKYKQEGTIPPPDDELPGQMTIFDYRV